MRGVKENPGPRRQRTRPVHGGDSSYSLRVEARASWAPRSAALCLPGGLTSRTACSVSVRAASVAGPSLPSERRRHLSSCFGTSPDGGLWRCLRLRRTRPTLPAAFLQSGLLLQNSVCLRYRWPCAWALRPGLCTHSPVLAWPLSFIHSFRFYPRKSQKWGPPLLSHPHSPLVSSPFSSASTWPRPQAAGSTSL